MKRNIELRAKADAIAAKYKGCIMASGNKLDCVFPFWSSAMMFKEEMEKELGKGSADLKPDKESYYKVEVKL